MKIGRLTTIISKVIKIYVTKKVSRSAAELAYFLTLSIFPLLICLNYFLGRFFPDTDSIISFAEGIIPLDTMNIILDYVGYVSSHNSEAMLMAGLILMATSSGPAFRSLHNIMGDISGETRYKGFFTIIVSFLFSLAFLATMYFAAAVVVTGKWFLKFIDDHIMFISVSDTWAWLRFVLLFFILLVMMYGIYRIISPKNTEVKMMKGAMFASLTLVGVSIIFSWFIGISVRYPLVYGSLASIIILMIWLYMCGNIVVLGNVLNVVLAQEKIYMPVKGKRIEPPRKVYGPSNDEKNKYSR